MNRNRTQELDAAVVQAALKCLRLAAPRTTQTQEGIAVFSEIITTAIDVGRLRRITRRVVAIKQALDGADFLEVFESFLEAGQSEREGPGSCASLCTSFPGSATSAAWRRA